MSEEVRPPQELPRDIAKKILNENGITGRGASVLAISLEASVSDDCIRGLLSIQRPPGYKSGLDTIAEFSPRLAAKASFNSETPDFTIEEELIGAVRALKHLETDPEGDLAWMNREHWNQALRSFAIIRKTMPFVKALLRGDRSEMERNAKITFLLAALAVGGNRWHYFSNEEYEVLDGIYPELKTMARKIAEEGGHLEELASSFFEKSGVRMYQASHRLFERVEYEEGSRAHIHIANDIVLASYQVVQKPDAFEKAAKEFYKKDTGLDVDAGAQFLKENS